MSRGHFGTDVDECIAALAYIESAQRRAFGDHRRVRCGCTLKLRVEDFTRLRDGSFGQRHLAPHGDKLVAVRRPVEQRSRDAWNAGRWWSGPFGDPLNGRLHARNAFETAHDAPREQSDEEYTNADGEVPARGHCGRCSSMYNRKRSTPS